MPPTPGPAERTSRYRDETPLPAARPRNVCPPRSHAEERSLVPARRGEPQYDAGSIADHFQTLKLTSFYVKPGYGNDGKAIDVLSNFFMVRAKGGRDAKGKIIQ
jgi:eukaryotic translation initiation factor 2C